MPVHAFDAPMSAYGTNKRINIRLHAADVDVEGYTAHDFRDTCATEWRESGISIDLIARLLGHKKTDVTEQRYVKYRPELFSQIKDKMDVYGINNGTNTQR